MRIFVGLEQLQSKVCSISFGDQNERYSCTEVVHTSEHRGLDQLNEFVDLYK